MIHLILSPHKYRQLIKVSFFYHLYILLRKIKFQGGMKEEAKDKEKETKGCEFNILLILDDSC